MIFKDTSAEKDINTEKEIFEVACLREENYKICQYNAQKNLRNKIYAKIVSGKYLKKTGSFCVCVLV